jgi:hypothetical protein
MSVKRMECFVVQGKAKGLLHKMEEQPLSEEKARELEGDARRASHAAASVSPFSAAGAQVWLHSVGLAQMCACRDYLSGLFFKCCSAALIGCACAG